MLEENQRVLISDNNANNQIFAMLTSEIPELQNKTLALLRVYSTLEDGRSMLLKHLNPSRYVHIFHSFSKI